MNEKQLQVEIDAVQLRINEANEEMEWVQSQFECLSATALGMVEKLEEENEALLEKIKELENK